jgi:Xaa-Pro aminopeptidase
VPSASGLTTGGTFRQTDNFLYFTGLELPKSMLWVDADHGTVFLFTPDRDPRWESDTRPNDFPGRLLGADPEVVQLAAVDSVLPVDSFGEHLAAWVGTDRPVWLDRVDAVGERPALIPEEGITPEVELQLAIARRFPGLTVADGSALIARLRVVKSPAEVAAIERAVDAAAVAMRHAVGQVRVGVTERTLIGQFEAECRREGAARFPFTPIVKSGPNALWPWRVLASHAERRDRALVAGDIVIFDVGCEVDSYVSDIGRTFPVSGRFSAGQRRAVELVTAVSDAILAAIRPGVTLAEVQKVAYAAIPESQRRYMQTGSFFGHHIGLNVGDPADFDAVLAPGMVFTVEPWYYNHDTGIAAFIEDNVVVTESGVRVLSNALPREATELERMILP